MPSWRLAWLLGQPGVTAVIAGAGSADAAIENAEAAALASALSASERQSLGDAFAASIPMFDRDWWRPLALARRVFERLRGR